MNDLEKALDELTPAQAAAVNWTEGPLFVLAGPGSGKTRVLTTRVAKLLAETPEKSFRVMALTFTNKAADEMATRIEAFVPDQQNRATIGTFHSFFMQMLQQHGSHIGINPNFAIYSLESDRADLLKEAIRENGLSSEDERFLGTIDKLKARLIQPEGCAQRFREASVGERVERTYLAYEEALSRANALDFGSLIAQAYRLISAFPGVGIHYRRAYSYWMFDEFQDTTVGQYRLIKRWPATAFATSSLSPTMIRSSISGTAQATSKSSAFARISNQPKFSFQPITAVLLVSSLLPISWRSTTRSERSTNSRSRLGKRHFSIQMVNTFVCCAIRPKRRRRPRSPQALPGSTHQSGARSPYLLGQEHC